MNDLLLRLHPPAMVAEVLEFLRLNELPGGVVCDLTIGTGGHALAMLRANPHIRLIGFDRDERSLAVAQDRLTAAGVEKRCRLIQADHRHLLAHLDKSDADHVVGVCLDAGVSLYQLDDPGRGFSFRRDGPLDLRLSPTQETRTGADLLAEASESELVEMLTAYGEERFRARRISSFINRRKQGRPVRTSRDLVEVVHAALKGSPKRVVDVAVTRVFGALRVALSEELIALRQAIRAAVDVLQPGGRIVVLSYDSGEERVVKELFSLLSRSGPGPGSSSPFPADPPLLRVLTPKPVTPSRREVTKNPRARTAKLRCAEKCA